MTTPPSTIAARAEQAAEYLRAITAQDPDPRWHAEEQALAHLRLAALLGIAPTDVTTTDDELRATRKHDALILTATDPTDPDAVHRFSLIDPRYDDEPFRLLGPCPGCGSEVAFREIRTLADLARAGRVPQLPDEASLPEVLRTASSAQVLLTDPGHRDRCAYGS
ncbi:hypothetical protein OG455_34605 [Kitasatospora sp. NBC_01287]|uniref:hypothetical protein n=1 Tax=Kitasatospora sp. NBC_01287 TaxID=2903573 RepID=UPI00225AD6F3|nr:hypothetical protein [Kitasatospora sp. NBC_01287]MCX4750581.1 hypothetical protein [Kitasatospora sp. NBC_01287]